MPISDEELMRYCGVRITNEMRDRASEESKKREPYIMHHFETDSYSQQETNSIGFFGEFAFRQLMGFDWKDGIRKIYENIDSNDMLINGWVIDVKTETIPDGYIWRVLTRTIPDNEYFGRRLYHVGQQSLLQKYDIVVMGAIMRANFAEIDAWFPIGWIYASQVANYPNGRNGPVHHSTNKPIRYPFPGYQITTSDLTPLNQLFNIIQKPKI